MYSRLSSIPIPIQLRIGIGIVIEKFRFMYQGWINDHKLRKWIFWNLDYTIYANYSSITEAAKSLNCNEKTIIRALKTEKNLLKKRWIVKYI